MDWNPTVFDLAHALRPLADLEGRLYTAIAQAVGNPVLEMGCGTARVLLELLRAGVDIDGVERDSSMANAARHKLDQAGFDRATVSLGDMTTFRPHRSYRLVTFPGNTLGSITTPAVLARVFDNAARCLVADGEVAFDVTQVPAGTETTHFDAPIPNEARPELPPTIYRQRVRFDAATATEHITERIEFADGEVIEHQLEQHVWTLAALEQAFTPAGLSFRQPPIDETGVEPSSRSHLLFVRLSRQPGYTA